MQIDPYLLNGPFIVTDLPGLLKILSVYVK